MSLTLSDIDLAEIDFSDFTYSVWAWSDYCRVQESIAAAGVMEPPSIIKESDRYAIVSGHKRLRALAALGRQTILCRILSRPAIPCQLFINTVLENLSFRDYNIVEKSLILNKLQTFAPCGYPIEKLLPSLGVNQSNLNNIKKLANLSQETMAAVACGKVRPGAGLEFVEMTSESQKEFIKALQIVDLGENKQKEVIRFVLDLAKTANCPPEKILNGDEVKRILHDPILNAPQKGAHLRALLHRKRMPVLSQMELDFEKAKGRLHIPKNIKILNASPFEDDAIKISISIASNQDVNASRRFLDELSEEKNFDLLLRAATGLQNNPE